MQGFSFNFSHCLEMEAFCSSSFDLKYICYHTCF
uniref:Uncharacterized protein n=1 Tax=Ciona intestinalis TaxID=7719 RepID=H2XVU5_CIOIN